MKMIEQQLLIMFYKKEVQKNPKCIASQALLTRSREEFMKMKEDSYLTIADMV